MRQLVKQLGFAKRAFKHDALKNDTPDVEGEWEKFAASHSEELETLDEGEYKSRFVLRLTTHKIAASFIGVLLASGIAFAAIQVVRNISTPKPQLPSTSKRPTSSLSRPCPQIRLRPIQFPLSHTFSIMCHLTLCSQPLLQPTVSAWSLRMKRLASFVSTLYGSVKTVLREY